MTRSSREGSCSPFSPPNWDEDTVFFLKLNPTPKKNTGCNNPIALTLFAAFLRFRLEIKIRKERQIKTEAQVLHSTNDF